MSGRVAAGVFDVLDDSCAFVYGEGSDKIWGGLWPFVLKALGLCVLNVPFWGDGAAWEGSATAGIGRVPVVGATLYPPDAIAAAVATASAITIGDVPAGTLGGLGIFSGIGN